MPCGLTKSTSFNELCKRKYYYSLQKRIVPVHLVLSVKQWHPELRNSQVSLFFFIIHWKKGIAKSCALPSYLIFAEYHDCTEIFHFFTQETQAATRLQNHEGNTWEAQGFPYHQIPNRHRAESSRARQVKLPALSKPVFMNLWQPPG